MKLYGMIAAIAATLSVVQAAPMPGGPTGGKLLESTPRVEFFVNAERKVEIRLFDDQLKPLPIGSEVIGVIAQAPAGRTALTLAPAAGALISTEALPEGDGYTVVVQVRATAESKPQNFRIALHMHTCGGCQLPEYACTCDHGSADSHEGHGP